MSVALGYEPTDDPGWDEMRASSWDLYGEDGRPLTDLAELLVLIGAGDQPPEQQRVRLREWADGPACVPAPQELKDEIRRFLAA